MEGHSETIFKDTHTQKRPKNGHEDHLKEHVKVLFYGTHSQTQKTRIRDIKAKLRDTLRPFLRADRKDWIK